ncbi:hypothetical protein SDC9_175235 [bioreactor metagenome]|uniref:Uncharacterized protein n=1 Tax=bioreactor metagenome TaxID=1076179 RepID=A0A645GLH4_9ZZZZ
MSQFNALGIVQQLASNEFEARRAGLHPFDLQQDEGLQALLQQRLGLDALLHALHQLVCLSLEHGAVQHFLAGKVVQQAGVADLAVPGDGR